MVIDGDEKKKCRKLANGACQIAAVNFCPKFDLLLSQLPIYFVKRNYRTPP